MKTVFKSMTILSLTALLSMVLVTSCSQDDVITPVANNVSTGSDVINTSGADAFRLDKTHSNVNWQTVYYGDNALLNGKFNSFGMSVNFDEANPSATEINAWVSLSSFNTGEPGRDSYGKCGPGYMGVVFDTVSPSPLELAPRGSTDTAWFNSKSVKVYGNGYMATGDFIFRGVNKEVDMYFTYSGITKYTSSSGAETERAGFEGEFSFLAKTDYGLTSGSIADKVSVLVNANFRKNL